MIIKKYKNEKIFIEAGRREGGTPAPSIGEPPLCLWLSQAVTSPSDHPIVCPPSLSPPPRLPGALRAGLLSPRRLPGALRAGLLSSRRLGWPFAKATQLVVCFKWLARPGGRVGIFRLDAFKIWLISLDVYPSLTLISVGPVLMCLQVFAVRSGGATGVVVKGPDDKNSIAFRYLSLFQPWLYRGHGLHLSNAVSVCLVSRLVANFLFPKCRHNICWSHPQNGWQRGGQVH